MSTAARIIVVGEEPHNQNGLVSILKDQGFDSVSAPFNDRPEDFLPENGHVRRPDAIVLNALDCETSDQLAAVKEYAKFLASPHNHYRVPLVVVAERSVMDSVTAQEIVSIGVDDVILKPFNPVHLKSRISALMRLKTMRGELVRRIDTQAKYGVDAPELETVERPEDGNVLVTGDATSFAFLESALAGDATLVGALTPTIALEYMLRRDFDAVVIDATQDIEKYLDFVGNARMNAQLYNVPIIMMVDDQILPDVDKAYSVGVTDVMLKPVDEQELSRRVNSYMKELRFRDALRSIYSQALHMATSDSLTGLYSRGFLLEHLKSVISDYEKWAQPFSLAYFSIYNMNEINDEYGYVTGDRMIRQAGSMLGMLVRGEDLCARIEGPDFVLVMPDTNAKDGDIAMRRIFNVINNTEFSVNGFTEPIHLELVSRVAPFMPGDTAETLIHRTKDMLPRRSNISIAV